MNKKANRILTSLFAAGLLFVSLTAVQAQKKRESIDLPNVGTATGAVTGLGTAILNSATSVFGDDPYAQFRDAKYSNDGLMTEAEEIKLGNQLHIEFSKKFKYVSTGQGRVDRIGSHVAQFSGRPGLPYKFYVIEDKEFNAFSAPGGHVYVTTALMNLATDDELAAVLAHEIGHVTARHSLQSLQESQAVDSIAAVIGSLTGVVGNEVGQLGTLAAQLVASPFILAHSREQEREADFLGIHTAARAGYDPQAMVTMLHKMERISKNNSDLLGSFFSDHPDTQERITNTEYEIRRIKGGH